MERQGLSRVLLEMVEYETGEKCPAVDEATDLRLGLKLDSLDMVSLILQVENRLQIQIPTEDLNSVTTVGDLLDVLQSKVDGREGPLRKDDVQPSASA